MNLDNLLNVLELEYDAAVASFGHCANCNKTEARWTPAIMDIHPDDRDLFPAPRLAILVCHTCVKQVEAKTYVEFFQMLQKAILEAEDYVIIYKNQILFDSNQK